MKKLLIAFCGLDGSGKTTQLQKLHKWLESIGESTLITKQPGNEYRNNLRVRKYLDTGNFSNMKALALLAAADRQNHISEVIIPGLQTGHVLTDRYLYSSFAFFKTRGLDIEFIKQINPDVPTPDLTIFLDISPDNALKRIFKRDGYLKFEERNNSTFNEIRDTFLKVLPEKTLRLDAQLPEQEIHIQIKNKVKELM